ncbi:MAG TPA: hypothetical protein GXZ45_12525 [Propionibacterium sp.]|nr:hypothetical protein [Propionibacterium sp.]
MATSKLEPLLSHAVFRWASGINALIALALGVLGTTLGGNPDLRAIHAVLAIIFLGTSLISALTGMRYGKQSNTKGLALLGFVVFGLGVVQYGLGEMAITWPHMLLGFAIVLAAGMLFVRSLAQPVVYTGQRVASDETPRDPHLG